MDIQFKVMEEPRLNDKFPIDSPKQISPPSVGAVHECARSIHVSGFVPHAYIRVYANSTEEIGHKSPYVGFDDIPIKPGRVLHAGEKITGYCQLGNVAEQYVRIAS